jgi:hypothetical protein
MVAETRTMRGLRSTLVLVVLLAGLVGYIYYLNGRESTSTDTKEKAFAAVKNEDVDDVRIKAADGQTTRVQKADGSWKIVEPEAATADQGELTSITSSLADLQIQRVVDEKASDLKQYGLEPARIEVEFRSKGAKEPKRIELGEKTPTGGDMYARFPGQPRVFLVSSFLDSTFNKNTFALRDKRVISIDRDKVDRVEILKGGKPAVTLAKTGMDWRIVAPLMVRADFAAVEGALERLSSGQMQAIMSADGADLKKHKLDPPVATITAGSGSSRATLLFGETENALIYAKDASRPMVFTVAPTLFTDVIRDIGEFRRKDLFDFRSFTATHVEFKRGAETIALDKTKNKDGSEEWKNGAGKQVPAMKVEDLLSKVSGLQAVSFDAAAHAALKTPALVVTIRFDENKTEQVTFAKAGGDVLASRSDEPGTGKVMAPAFDDVFKGIDEMK